MRLVRYAKDPFNKIIIIQYPNKIVIGFITTKEDFEKVKDELEKIGEVVVNEVIDNIITVEVHTTTENISKVLKIIKDIRLFELGKEVGEWL